MTLITKETIPFQCQQFDEGPGLHAPDIGCHEEDDNHPFPPAEDPVQVGSSVDVAPPGKAHADGCALRVFPNTIPQKGTIRTV